MKEVITVNEMRRLDAFTISSGILGLELMWKAAQGVYESYNWEGTVGIFCGSGNNAGDGYALATILHENGFDVEVILLSNKFSEDGLFYFNKCVEMKIPVMNFSSDIKEYDIYVDALLGTGFKGNPRESILDAINYINKQNKPVVSIDINSGLNGDNGLCSAAVRSDLTVSVGYFKPGLFLNMAKDYMKTKVNKEIGINLLDKPFYLIEENDVKAFFKPRKNICNKGSFGYVGIIGGSMDYPGAIRLASLGQVALYSGSGVSRVIVPEEIYSLIFSNVLETTTYRIPSSGGQMIFDPNAIDKALKGLKTVGVGVGWGESAEYKKILEYILSNYDIPIVIDADGINTLSKMNLEILNYTKCSVILTPHLKEFSRLINEEVSSIKENSLTHVIDFVSKYNVTLLLKGPTTIVANKETLYFVDRGCAGMATAGSGDVLTGILVGLLGYNNDDITLTTAIAAYINGASGEMASKEYGDIGMVASDTAKMVRVFIANIVK